MNSTYIAHVADELEFAHGETDYDAAATYAANLLAASPDLVSAADAYSQGLIGAARFGDAVADAVRRDS